MGSKNRIAKDILPIILKERKENQWYLEPFVGGANIIDKIKGNRIGNDNNEYLIELLIKLQQGWKPPFITKVDYINIRNHKTIFPKYLVGWVGIGCSYSGKWFGGYAGEITTKIGTIRNYQKEAINNVLKQNLQGIKFISMDYRKIEIPKNSIIYCDPPYANTTKYKTDFNHNEFWGWCDELAKNGHNVFVSEYKAPKNWKCIWNKKVKSSLSSNGKIGGNKNSVEKLFTI